MRLATVAGGIAVAAAAMFAAPAVVSPGSHAIEVRAAPAPSQPQQQAPAPENKAIREQRATGRVRYWRGVPAAIKNRAGGERAHRRWRKAKASGRKAA